MPKLLMNNPPALSSMFEETPYDETNYQREKKPVIIWGDELTEDFWINLFKEHEKEKMKKRKRKLIAEMKRRRKEQLLRANEIQKEIEELKKSCDEYLRERNEKMGQKDNKI